MGICSHSDEARQKPPSVILDHSSNFLMARVSLRESVFDCSSNYCTVSSRAASFLLAPTLATAAPSTAAPLPAKAAAIARTSGRPSLSAGALSKKQSFSHCTDSAEAKGKRKRRSISGRACSLFFSLLRPVIPTLDPCTPDRLFASYSFHPNYRPSFALLPDSLPSLFPQLTTLLPLFGLFYLSWNYATAAADDANGEEEGESF